MSLPLAHGANVGVVANHPHNVSTMSKSRRDGDHERPVDCWTPAYIALGSNTDAPREQVEKGFEHLGRLANTILVARSPLYVSAPMGPVAQPDFVNAVAGILTKLAPFELLRGLKQLEQTLGREQPVVRWGPRRIDFDLLVYSDLQIESADLVIPHAGITQRNFVLYPLCDIAPDLLIPGKGVARTLVARLGSAGLRRIE
jgi:2-amino-4-hydroxy-6-hydroxymethyldihydropteridine diphosphokinase